MSRYAELNSLLTQLEKQKNELRAELLELHADGAQQEETGPYLLAFTDQEGRTVDWKSEALSLAATVFIDADQEMPQRERVASASLAQ